MSRPSRLAAIAALTAVAFAAPKLALANDDATKARAAAFQGVLDCRGVAEDAARLACYDAAAARMTEAESRGEIVVIDRAQAQTAHREAFGLHLPSLNFVTRALAPEEVDAVEGVVRALRVDRNGFWTFTLEDGAVWRQIAGELYHPPKVGSKVVIRRGVLQSYKMNVDRQPSIKVHRDQ